MSETHIYTQVHPEKGKPFAVDVSFDDPVTVLKDQVRLYEIDHTEVKGSKLVYRGQACLEHMAAHMSKRMSTHAPKHACGYYWPGRAIHMAWHTSRSNSSTPFPRSPSGLVCTTAAWDDPDVLGV